MPFGCRYRDGCHPQQGVQFGRLAEHSPLTGHELNDFVEFNCLKVTTMLSPPGKQALVRLTTTLATASPLHLASWKWMKDQIGDCWGDRC